MQGKKGRVSVVQIRVPVWIGSGLAPGRRLGDVEKEEVPIAMRFEEGDEFPPPPTYKQAMEGSKER